MIGALIPNGGTVTYDEVFLALDFQYWLPETWLDCDTLVLVTLRQLVSAILTRSVDEYLGRLPGRNQSATLALPVLANVLED